MIVRHIVEISEDDVMTYHFYYLSRATTLNSANTKLVTLAPVLCPERSHKRLSHKDKSVERTNSLFIFYLTIRVQARDFYAVIVGEGEARINYHLIGIESE